MQNILHFWKDIEIFNLPDFNIRKENAYPIKSDEDLPWLKEKRPISNNKKWSYILVFGKISQQAVIEHINGLLPCQEKNDWDEQVNGDTCLATLTLNENGITTEKSFTFASYLAGLNCLEKELGLSTIPNYLTAMKERFQERLNKTLDNKMTWTEIQREVDFLKQELPWLPWDIDVYVIEKQISKTNDEDEAYFMNSFFLHDLNYITDHPAQCSPTLAQYLSLSTQDDKRKDLLARKSELFATINPAKMTAGRWPSKLCYGLSTAQQGAVNTIFSELRNNVGLQGVNGPPGTGKTTLLLDVIAEIVVDRARVIAELGYDKLFGKWEKLKREKFGGFYHLDPQLRQNFGIVVASNNNSAVENISKELPLKSKIDSEAFPQADYFADYSTGLIDKESWGILAAALGNAINRNKFQNNFWSPSRFEGLLEQEKTKQESEQATNKIIFDEKRRQFNKLLADFEEFKKWATLFHEHGDENARKVLLEREQIKPEYLCDETFRQKSFDEIHLLTPYHSEKIARLRSEIFLTALELHKYAILSNAKQFYWNLETFFEMMTGQAKVSDTIAGHLWDSLFFCVPVVSTSLASVSKLLPNLDRNQIGWLLIDEAGQATPQSAAGIIQRAKRCVIVGDPLQVEPVVTIPKGLVTKLRANRHVDLVWSPYVASVQNLADRISAYGTYMGEDDQKIWTGFPLRTHRRCENPMFDIANAIAYDNQMVKAEEDKPRVGFIGESCWFDVQGSNVINRHVVLEEIALLKQKIDQLKENYQDEIYIISPFKSVAQHCSEKFRQDKQVSAGTIHRFQGKEADVVFIVLGSDPKSSGARKWASSKPNMLNVALTRAKKRCYVIGNQSLWGACPYYDTMLAMLK
ncbi:DEAD/DEAH box helicase [Lonepinella sp. BR2271]|uniref:DEAD/DEAH box helicase n=1 Tax=Lonepinella sp. BR2271 TaxID=3434550 RepID=UPI003F6DD1EF